MTCKYAQCGETIYTAKAVNGSRCALFVEACAGVIILAWRICRAVGIAQAIGRFMSYLLPPVIERCTFQRKIKKISLVHFEGISNIRSFALYQTSH